MSAYGLVAILLLAPLVGFLVNALRSRRPRVLLPGSLATLASATSFACAVLLHLNLIARPPAERFVRVVFADWISVGNFSAKAGFVVDSVSSLMLLVVCGVGTLIHLFSIGYMSEDERPSKYFAYLNLFLFNMLVLVLADNLALMFVGWEGVGLCSYLLIGFWFEDVEKANAGMKAFIANRVGDAAFLLGLFLLFTTFGTVTFSELIATAPTVAETGWGGPVTMACLLLMFGATGKSAQIPLYVWLPDAMAGPTPVSALIHAATMVTAGVYLIVRLNPLFVMAPNALFVVAVIGAATALMAALIGVAQWDIKKVLAYSTVSQLGYMFLGVGVGAFSAGFFHLITHAFFKALLFLGAGSVIHALQGEQDLRKMGALNKKLPITYWSMMVGWLAIIGIPPFAGFFSKDEILFKAFQSHPALWAVGLLGSGLTAFYMTRFMALVFWTPSRVGPDIHPHESPWSMSLPLVVLALLSASAGLIGVPHFIGESVALPNFLESWLKPQIATLTPSHASAALEGGLMGASVLVAALAAFTAYHFYLRAPHLPAQTAGQLGVVYNWVSNKFFVDEFYSRRLIHPLVRLSRLLWLVIDVKVIDRVTYLVTDLIRGAGRLVKSLQNGNMQHYALYFTLGVAATVFYIFKPW